MASDGTPTSTPPTQHYPSSPAEPDLSKTTALVLSKDVPINSTNKTFVRLFLPRRVIDPPPVTDQKLPLIFFYHGGGFLHLSAATTIFHVFCSNMALQLHAIVASVEYRLAPANRLPAAYDDAVDALHWIKTTKEEWVSRFTDLSSCFLMGNSAGGNIAYHAALRGSSGDALDQPLKVRGLILHHPFFGGTERTGSELRSQNDPVMPLPAIDQAWKLSLPVGADQDHEFCNPYAGGASDNNFERIRVMGWRVFVAACYGDPLIDRQTEFVKTLEGKGITTASYYCEGTHGWEVKNPSAAQDLFVVLKSFISA